MLEQEVSASQFYSKLITETAPNVWCKLTFGFHVTENGEPTLLGKSLKGEVILNSHVLKLILMETNERWAFKK